MWAIGMSSVKTGLVMVAADVKPFNRRSITSHGVVLY